MEGRLEKIKNNMALTNQATLSDPNKTVAELVKETIAAVGENIKVRHIDLRQPSDLGPVCCVSAATLTTVRQRLRPWQREWRSNGSGFPQAHLTTDSLSRVPVRVLRA